MGFARGAAHARVLALGGLAGKGPKGKGLSMMQTVPLALVRGAEGQPEERTLGTAVPAEGWTLAGTGALECQPSAGTERNWALQCPSQARHWPPVSLPEAPFPPLFSLKLLSNHSENGLYLA